MHNWSNPPERRFAPFPRGGERLGAALRRSLLALALAAALAGCAVTQPKPPQLDLPAATATAEQNALLERWWTAFDDPVLTALIEEAFANNLDLRGALARIEAARADVLLAQSNLYPSINLRAGASRSRQSQSTAAGGRVRHPRLERLQRRASRCRTSSTSGASTAAARSPPRTISSPRSTTARRVRITVAAEVASAYFRLRAADALLVVFEDTRKTRTDTVQLQQDRFDGGIIGEYDLRQAEAELSAVVADIARARQAIGLLESAIATLTGRSPRAVFTPEIARGASIEAATAVPQLPSGLPSRPARTAAGHPPRRGVARRVRPAHPAGAGQLFSERQPDRRLRHGIGGAIQPLHARTPRCGASVPGSCSRCSR